MWKSIRNTAFTAIALGLTALGLGWNREIAAQNDPVAISKSVLAAQEVSNEQPFHLLVKINTEHLRLGQEQTVTIETLPYARINIVTQYPDGSIDNQETITVNANKLGLYQQRYTLDNFRHVGVFTVSVIAEAGNKTAVATEHFELTGWSKNSKSQEGPTYQYPLLP